MWPKGRQSHVWIRGPRSGPREAVHVRRRGAEPHKFPLDIHAGADKFPHVQSSVHGGEGALHDTKVQFLPGASSHSAGIGLVCVCVWG